MVWAGLPCESRARSGDRLGFWPLIPRGSGFGVPRSSRHTGADPAKHLRVTDHGRRPCLVPVPHARASSLPARQYDELQASAAIEANRRPTGHDVVETVTHHGATPSVAKPRGGGTT